MCYSFECNISCKSIFKSIFFYWFLSGTTDVWSIHFIRVIGIKTVHQIADMWPNLYVFFLEMDFSMIAGEVAESDSCQKLDRALIL